MNLWEKCQTVQAGVDSLPIGLKALLGGPNPADSCVEWLKDKYSLDNLLDPLGEPVFHWDMVGMFFSLQKRDFEAIAVQKQLYELRCHAQEGQKRAHKGHQLVRLRDSHRELGHPWHAERYLLLTLIEDALRAEGRVRPESSGVPFRFRWQDGRSAEELEELSTEAWEQFAKNPELCEFPEEILRRLGSRYSKAAASQKEADYYDVNSLYAGKMLLKADGKDWKAFEQIACYMLSCVPGFHVEPQKQTAGSIFDIFVTIRGNYADFRRELGTYALGECKNWSAPVSTKEIAYMAQNLILNDCSVGILFSSSGITGTEDMKFAALTVLRAYHHSGRFILVLDKADIQLAAKGRPLQEILREKYEEVRFDLHND